MIKMKNSIQSWIMLMQFQMVSQKNMIYFFLEKEKENEKLNSELDDLKAELADLLKNFEDNQNYLKEMEDELDYEKEAND